MITLAIDTALAHCQAAVLVDGAVRGASKAPAQGDAEAIGEHVDGALDAARMTFRAIERVAVTVGPGSFTGVRVGIAYAKGIGVACGIPAVGVSTLAVLAHQAGLPSLAVIDARHGALFAGLYTSAAGAPLHLARTQAEDCVTLARAHGVTIVGLADAVAVAGQGTRVEGLDLATLSRLASGDPTGRAPRPLYLAPVDAAPQSHKALARA